MRRRRLAVAAFLVVLAAPVVAVLGVVAAGRLGAAPAERTVRGVLLEVQASSPVYADQVTLRDDEGQTWSFRVDPAVSTNREEPQSAGHLRQHMALVEPMLVRYRETPDGPIAMRIVDAE